MTRHDSFTFRQLRFNEVETISTEYDDVLNSTLIHFANTYTSSIIEDNYNENSTKVDWHCFECKCKIKVDVTDILTDGEFTGKKLFCKAHKPPKYAIAYKKNYIFQRYLMSFHHHLKGLIIRNSKVTNLLAWKELQGSASTSQLTQPESRSLYRKQKRKTKKLFTFKSVLGTKKSQHQ